MNDTETIVCEDIKARAAVGLKKYGISVADNPLTQRQWLQHHYEELLDAAVYVRRLMQEMDAKKPAKWRMLDEGEIVEEGDEFEATGGGWFPSECIGLKFKPQGGLARGHLPHRRRVTPDLSELSQHITELLKHE
jgi:hypothetical protein